MKEIPRRINRNSQIILVSHNYFAIFKAPCVIQPIITNGPQTENAYNSWVNTQPWRTLASPSFWQCLQPTLCLPLKGNNTVLSGPQLTERYVWALSVSNHFYYKTKLASFYMSPGMQVRAQRKHTEYHSGTEGGEERHPASAITLLYWVFPQVVWTMEIKTHQDFTWVITRNTMDRKQIYKIWFPWTHQRPKNNHQVTRCSRTEAAQTLWWMTKLPPKGGELTEASSAGKPGGSADSFINFEGMIQFHDVLFS